MKRIFLTSAILLVLTCSEAASQTPTAVIVPNGYTQFSDANGKPLSNGTVFFYTPGTTTSKTTWQDPYQSIVNANPVVLNGSGEALIWGSGIYRQVVYDVNNNLIWDQLTGGYNCVGGGVQPGGANGAIQYNNNGILGGLPLGNSSQVLIGNATGPATWGSLPLAALPGGVTGTGPFVLQNGPTINNAILNTPTIHSPTIDGGTWTNGTFVNPTFSGTISGLPGGGGGAANCTDRNGTVQPHCVGSDDIFNITFQPGAPSSTGYAVDAWTSSGAAAWAVYFAAGREAAEAQAHEAQVNIAKIPQLEAEIRQLAAELRTHK